MNAVERLLSHADRVVAFLDQTFGRKERLDPLTAEQVNRVVAKYEIGSPVVDQTVIQAAIVRAIAERTQLRGRDGIDAIARRAFDVCTEMLAERERLLDKAPIQSMLSDVIADSMTWGPHAKTVVRLAKSLGKAIHRLRKLPGHNIWCSDARPFWVPSGPIRFASDWINEKSAHLQPAIDALRIYSRPPTKAVTPKPIANVFRRGGRPQTNDALARDLLAGWKAFEPEIGRRLKRDYLAERADVRYLKNKDARERKIDSLLVALDSALHLQREKTKRKRAIRG